MHVSQWISLAFCQQAAKWAKHPEAVDCKGTNFGLCCCVAASFRAGQILVFGQCGMWFFGDIYITFRRCLYDFWSDFVGPYSVVFSGLGQLLILLCLVAA